MHAGTFARIRDVSKFGMGIGFSFAAQGDSMKLSTLHRFAFLVIGGSIASASSAIVAYDNFGPGDTYDTSTGWTESGPASVAGTYMTGCQFKSGVSGMLSSITLAVGHLTGTNSVDVQLYADSGSGSLGTLMATFTLTGCGNFGSNYVPGIVTNANPGVQLAMGSEYWVVPVASPDSWHAWNWNNTGAMGQLAYSTDNGSSFSYFADRTGAMRVEVGAVPEPGTMAALGAGLLAIARRRKKA